eukprot:CAMPEP_0202891188 /NCGR_PEP_ID=MMETSP1392-20130828/1317_1 /ASSEMBLY_ACC=CAM_ASM_000868 /TAXON_ID=225041 /ORGANISM="Chlamydomonas chlamydogama, Strain SAG 11-48b" /LENGTH=187 /DNA_ID=CAMNT_0049574873 /DNA_START=213 /DNA_END=776 /DNA_ORIENTATION=+
MASGVGSSEPASSQNAPADLRKQLFPAFGDSLPSDGSGFELLEAVVRQVRNYGTVVMGHSPRPGQGSVQDQLSDALKHAASDHENFGALRAHEVPAAKAKELLTHAIETDATGFGVEFATPEQAAALTGAFFSLYENEGTKWYTNIDWQGSTPGALKYSAPLNHHFETGVFAVTKDQLAFVYICDDS